MKPHIGITTTWSPERSQHELWDAYTRAILYGGGVPVILPSTADYALYNEYLDRLDGLLLSGGQDIMPTEYGQEPRCGFELTWQMEPDRDRFELVICQQALKRDMPILGICRGEQLLAVALGGSLYQDTKFAFEPDDETLRIRHFQVSPWEQPSHLVNILDNSLLANVLDSTEIQVNSLHHQAVCDLPDGFIASAKAADGIIEAIESTKHRFVLGVQWHPERMVKRDVYSRDLFAAFVSACGK
ncbi:MAG: gamma-glutamyl-gamma-aminobutyrate hydrolase family protein [Coriobacteriales bacterium]|jgi:putative glutamine amidotransferase|nr:gamma-glutamyl-gamma-aminobutyrate hydrolase family protein [Coriobacteriales bacterium]